MGSRVFCLCQTTRGTSFRGWEKPARTSRVFEKSTRHSNRTLERKMWLTPEVREHLVYWRNPLETGVVFGSVLVMLVAVRIYKSVLTALGKSQDKSHPFQKYLDADVELPAERVLALTEEVVFHLNALITKFKNIYLVENMIESLKFAAAMYLMTFVGRLVNMVTLLIIAWVTIFACPRLYQDNQTKIDEALAPIKVKVEELTSKLTTATSKKIE